MDNLTIARQLTNRAATLDRAAANLYRRQAYRRAAEAVLAADRSLEAILADDGPRGLRSLPHIGRRLARTIERLIRTGSMPVDERQVCPVRR